ncbi:MAG: hypothetical protein P5702_15650 [Limnospira sp. PMC 1291.21]|uniref:Uncharacterized protein n=2 Tax=Limnospira TaxID=2596745 RepID=B5VZ99_LIMMA|nr:MULTISPECIES: hypothetical protein [Limnospira]MDC0839009.1 hypothetical protein [Limnoraphis robusta]MDY7051524.1 hypothetical protein [Limnospira fusiformis LS22]QJB24454.1 hypothetical protein HFV01_29735 [Limnospira fusiformis SAG 85.79]RAQ48783.1 hypothetical protein B9S53_01980 [Arthrospira sp. O9.13F]UWU45788.1 hypothetical protein APLC1_0472 [Arthrospira platensis C1]
MIVVSNTSPLIPFLAKVEQFSLMPQLYGRILIPCAVHEELLDSRAGDTVITAVRSAIRMHKPITETRFLCLPWRNPVSS